MLYGTSSCGGIREKKTGEGEIVDSGAGRAGYLTGNDGREILEILPASS